MNITEVREQFPITRHYNFQNHASVSPMSGPATEAMIGYARELAESAYLSGKYYRAAESVRQLAARLINAETGEITFAKNTTEGVNYVANGIQWLSGDNVVTTAMEFPANLYPWMNLQQRGVLLKLVAEEDGHVPFDRIAGAIDNRTRVVSISAVQWGNGFRTDLTRLGELCKDKGVLLFVDAIQGLGVHPIDVKAMNIDFLSSGAHKWLLGPEGVGIFFCRRELIGHLRPSEPGYMCMKQGYDAPLEFNLHDDARRFDSGAYNLAGICALGASIEMFLEIGINEIQKRVKHLTDVLVEGVRKKGWRVASPRTASEWSGIVSFWSDKHDLNALRKHLRKEFRVVVAQRLGKLRSSPHFYNTEDEIQQLIDALPTD